MVDTRDQLVKLIDRKVFDPILKKSERSFRSEEKRKKYRNLRKSTETEKRRFHSQYRSAQEVKNSYISDLHSKTGRKKGKEAEELGLPKMPDIENEFKKLCEKLGV